MASQPQPLVPLPPKPKDNQVVSGIDGENEVYNQLSLLRLGDIQNDTEEVRVDDKTFDKVIEQVPQMTAYDLGTLEPATFHRFPRIRNASYHVLKVSIKDFAKKITWLFENGTRQVTIVPTEMVKNATCDMSNQAGLNQSLLLSEGLLEYESFIANLAGEHLPPTTRPKRENVVVQGRSPIPKTARLASPRGKSSSPAPKPTLNVKRSASSNLDSESQANEDETLKMVRVQDIEYDDIQDEPGVVSGLVHRTVKEMDEALEVVDIT